MSEITVLAIIEKMDTVMQFVDQHLEAAHCSEKVIGQVELAVEEIYTNITNYAYHPEHGTARIRCEIKGEPLQIIIDFFDEGKPYNPLEREMPDVNAGIDEREIGGLGIFLVRKMMDEVEYQFVDGKNILTIRKNVEERGTGRSV